MATGAIGGVPTITNRSFTWTGNITNFVYYTCPANTVAYINLNAISKSNAGGAATIITQMSVAYSTIIGTKYIIFPGSGFSVTSNTSVPLMGNTIYLSNTTAFLPMSGRAANPVASNETNQIGRIAGQVILYPGESLAVTNTANNGTMEIRFSTIEVTSG